MRLSMRKQKGEKAPAGTDDHQASPEQHTEELAVDQNEAPSANGRGTTAAANGSEGRPRRQRKEKKEKNGAGGGMNAVITRLFGEPSATPSAESQRQAAAELQATTAPAMERLVASVPGASSPDEARAALERQSAEDPGPGDVESNTSYFGNREVETAVHYQIRKHLEQRKYVGQHEREWVRHHPAGARRGTANGNSFYK